MVLKALKDQRGLAGMNVLPLSSPAKHHPQNQRHLSIISRSGTQVKAHNLIPPEHFLNNFLYCPTLLDPETVS